MIDTVVLTLDKSQFGIMPSFYDSFTPSARGILEPPYYSLGKQKMIKCVLCPNASDRRKGVYLPRITLFKAVRTGGISIFLHVEFSAPKILLNNNFDELTDDDFDDVCTTLARKLRQMGIFVFAQFIANADVKTIHFGKNINTGYTTASSIVAEIAKANITTRKEADIQTYSNNGETVHFFTTRRSVAAYDKPAELKKAKKTEKGRIEKDSYCQLSLLEDYGFRRPFEVLRVEARYNSRQTIKDILSKIDYGTEDLTFRGLFSSKISQAALKYEMAIIEEGLAGIPQNRQSIYDFTNDIFALNPKASFRVKMCAVAVKTLFIEKGSRDIRKQVGATSSQWSRLVNDMSQLRYQRSKLTGMEVINEALAKFTPVKLQDYKNTKFEV